MEHSRSTRRIPPSHSRIISTALAVWLVTHALCAPAHAASTSIPPANQRLEGPQATLEKLISGYRELSPESVVATFTADYHFHSFGDSLAAFMSGRSREEEAQVVENLLRGQSVFRSREGKVNMPRADSLGMRMDGIREGIDPEHPDSAQHYRVLTVSQLEMGFLASNGERYITMSREHIFHVVRGDVALLVDGQVANARQWYIRRWIEDVTGIREILAGEQGRCGEPSAPAVGPRSSLGGNVTALAIRPLMNPACAKLEVACDLPGTEPARVEVFDVSGRRVHTRQVPVAAAGAMNIEAGKGATIIPGVYWVRLSQATRKPSTRMVVVAR